MLYANPLLIIFLTKLNNNKNKKEECKNGLQILIIRALIMKVIIERQFCLSLGSDKGILTKKVYLI